jgi:hypothetical protein
MCLILFPLTGYPQTGGEEKVKKVPPKNKLKPLPDKVKLKNAGINTVAIDRSLQDTIRIRGSRAFVFDPKKIAVFDSGLARDSMSVPLATSKDMAAYQNAVDRLKNIIQEDPYQNVANYIDLETELVLPDTDNISQIFNSATNRYPMPQLLLNQLTVNIHMIREILSNFVTEPSSFRVLDMLIENNRQLSSQTVFSLGNMVLMKHVSYPTISVIVLDSNQSIIPSALGYLVRNDVVRKVGFTFCDFTVKPCKISDFNKLVVNASHPYLTFTGSQVGEVPFGKYHLFVSDGKAVYYTGRRRIHESIPSNEKIMVQLP